jgi:hypothetical protein
MVEARAVVAAVLRAAAVALVGIPVGEPPVARIPEVTEVPEMAAVAAQGMMRIKGSAFGRSLLIEH